MFPRISALIDRFCCALRRMSLEDCRASIAVETAVVMPVALILVVGTFDTAQYVRNCAVMDRVAATTANLVTQSQAIDLGTQTAGVILPPKVAGDPVGSFFQTAELVASNLPFTAHSRVIISSVDCATQSNPGTACTNPRVLWQATSDTHPDYQASSIKGTFPEAKTKIGSVGGPATIPNGVTIYQEHNVIIVEVFYEYQPLTRMSFFDKLIYRSALFRPRYNTDLRV